MLKQNFKIIFPILLLFFLFGAGFVYALEITYPRIPGAVPPQDFLNDPSVFSEDILSLYVKYFFNLALWIAGIIALAALIYGGLRYLISTGKPEAMVSAKDQIISAFFGLLILLSSYLILKTLSPQFIELKIPKLEPVEIEKIPEIVRPEIGEVQTSIDVEMPFARVIEKIFETYIADYPEPKPPEIPRMERITTNAETTKEIADKLKTQSEDLKSASDACECGRAEACCGISSPGCTLGTDCFSKPGCTSDPCRGSPRSRIQELVGGSSLSSILNPGELLQYNDIMGNISSILGAENIAPALELSTNLANSVGNIGDFSNVLGFSTNISNIIGIPGDLAQVFEVAGDLINITRNPSDLFASIGDLVSLIGMPENLSQLFDFAEIGLNVIENPYDLNAIFGAIEGISEQAGLNLNEVFQAVGPIGNIVMNSQDLNTVFGEIQGIAGATGINLNEVFLATNSLKGVAENPEDLARVLGQIEEISTKVGVSDLNEIFKIVGEASKIAQNPQELIEIIEPQIINIVKAEFLYPVLKNIENIANLTINIPELINVQATIGELAMIGLSSQQLTTVLDGLEGISEVIKAPTDLTNLQIAIQDLFEIGLVPQEITDILGNLGDLSGVIKTPTDLGNIGTAVQDLLNIIPVPENLTKILGELQGISGIIQDPTNLSNIQSAVSQLAGIIPGLENFTNILGNLEAISNIIQAPTNLSNIMGSLAGLAQITPLGQFSDVLGQIDILGNLFQSPQNMIIAVTGKGKNQIEIDNLTAEKIKTEEEVRSLKEWLDRLKRAEKFIDDCPKRLTSSLAQLYSKKDAFESQDWLLRETKFWDDINIVYYKLYKYLAAGPFGIEYKTGKTAVNDFATFYCTQGGTTEEGYPFPISGPEPKLSGEESPEEAEAVLSEAMACSDEAPVGEIIDRAKRVSQLLIDKLETLTLLDEKLIEAVDELQVLISQCSSQRCFSECICISCGKGGSCCPCIKRCEGNPCPSGQIANQLDEIRRIWQEIVYVIEGKEGNDTPENIGIIPIIEEVVPAILQDLENMVRIPMKRCSAKNWLEQDIVLFNCIQAKGAIIPPQNAVLNICCQTQSLEDERMQETTYGDCFGECYLEIGIENHRKCVQECLHGLGDPEISSCIHELNFYCCHVGD